MSESPPVATETTEAETNGAGNKKVQFVPCEVPPLRSETFAAQYRRHARPNRRQLEPVIFNQGKGLAIDPAMANGRNANAVVNSLTDGWADIERKCLACMRPGAHPCAQCFNCWYCSESCRRLDLSTHQTFCAGLEQISPRPTGMHHLGFLFHMDRNKPDLVWAKRLPKKGPRPPLPTPREQDSDYGMNSKENKVKSKDGMTQGDQEQHLPAQDSLNNQDVNKSPNDKETVNQDDQRKQDPVQNPSKAKTDNLTAPVDESIDWICWDSNMTAFHTSARTVTIHRNGRYGHNRFEDGRAIDVYDVKPDENDKDRRVASIVTAIRTCLSTSTGTDLRTDGGPLLIMGRWVSSPKWQAQTDLGFMEVVERNGSTAADGTLMGRMRDVELGDFRHLIDFCHLGGQGGKKNSQHREESLTGMISGARLLRIGTANRWEASLVSNVRLASNDLTAEEGEISPVSQLVGTPIRLRRYIETPGGENNKLNPLASFLMLRTDINDRQWGQIPLMWDGPVGTVLAVRVDGGEPAAFIRGLAQYCLDWVYPRFQKALKAGTQEAREAAVKTVTSEDLAKFLKYWEDA